MEELRKNQFLLLGVITIIFISLFFIGIQIPWSKLIIPGPLCLAHESIYRPGGCKACHIKGKGVIDEKCLNCHKQIMDKIRMNAGLHARAKSGCPGCHSEHHGRYYNLIKLDIETFDHNQTGWPLLGRHNILKCTACHDKGSYLLYKIRCIDCHEDFHNGENGSECLECHNPDSFSME